MIEHDAINSRWWGAPVARVSDGRFFGLEERERGELLAPYSWAEYRAPLDAMPDPWSLAAAGFAFSDAHIAFRVRLPPRVGGLALRSSATVRFADEAPFDPGGAAVRPFEHERFLLLDGATQQRVDDRYLGWARQLVRESPGTCLEVVDGSRAQGWFCSHRSAGRLDLTLAALYADASIGGATLYAAALSALGARGERVGGASFSVTNHDVHAIYAGLGARFTGVTGFWLWQTDTVHETAEPAD